MPDWERPVDSDDPSSKVIPNPLVPKLVVELEGERAEFLAFGSPNQWALMQNAAAAKSNNNEDQMGALYRLAITSIIPGPERPRFEAFMTDHGQDEDLADVLTDALFALWRGETKLPLVPTSSDSSPSTSETSSTSEGDSSEPESEPPPQPEETPTHPAEDPEPPITEVPPITAPLSTQPVAVLADWQRAVEPGSSIRASG